MAKYTTDFIKKGYVETLANKSLLFWNKKVPDTELEKFKKTIENKYDKVFETYWDLHKWSVEHFEEFWKEIWNYFDVISSKSYDQIFVKKGDDFLDNEWFPGARFNFAENLLRIRSNEPALVCLDLLGHEEEVTFSEMFEEVQLYAAAFRANGLNVGDRVACIMTNRKEALFLMLAAASIGAIFGGPLIFSGEKATANVLISMEPKFLIALDHAEDSECKLNWSNRIEYAMPLVPSLRKVIVLATMEETLLQLPQIPNSISLEEFLQSGLRPDGSVPDLVFEQLPFDHPIQINYTSGTTGPPKGVVHSAGSFLAVLRDYSISYGLERGDTIYSFYQVGWSVYNHPPRALALGCRLLLHSCYPVRPEVNIWNVFSKYKVVTAFLTPTMLDIIEKKHIVPDPGVDLNSFKILAIGASPLKRSNYEFLLKYVKKDMYIGYNYGATETSGGFYGFDLNSPAHMCEMQAPALGVDMHCFDERGSAVVGERGELVITTPTPSLPLYLWKDKDNTKLNQTYLSKYEGAWCQSDEGWINPTTRGIVVIGRSDDVIKQNGFRFSSTDIYFAIEHMDELQDYLCIGQTSSEGDSRAVLFVKMKEGHAFNPQMRKKIEQALNKEVSYFFTPKVILQIPDIPLRVLNL